MRFLIFLLSLFFFHAQSTVSFSEHLNQFRKSDGLNSSIIHAINQDKDGFLRVASRKGLNRFDGANWETIALPNALRSKQVINNCLLYDENFGLWLAGIRGLARRLNNTWTVFSKLGEHEIGTVQKIEVALNRLWVLADHYLFSFDGKKWKKENGHSISDFSIIGETLAVIQEKNLIRDFLKKPTQKTRLSEALRHIISSPENHYFLTEENNLFKDTSPSSAIKLPSYLLDYAYDKTTQRFYLACETGLYYLDNDILKRFHNPALRSAQITSLHISYLNAEEAILWIGTYKGLYNYRINSFLKADAKISLNALSHYQGKILFGTKSQGLFLWDKESLLPFHKKRFQNNRILSIAEKKNDLWVSTQDKLHFFSKNHWKSFEKAASKPLTQIIEILSNKQYSFFLSRFNGLFYHDGRKIQSIDIPQAKRFNSILLSKKNPESLWLATSSALYQIRKQRAKKISAIPIENITSLAEIGDRIFLGTEDSGVIYGQMSEEKHEFQEEGRIDIKSDLLADNFIEKIQSKGNYLFIKSSKNLSVFSVDKAIQILNRFSKEDGFEQSEEALPFLNLEDDVLILPAEKGWNQLAFQNAIHPLKNAVKIEFSFFSDRKDIDIATEIDQKIPLKFRIELSNYHHGDEMNFQLFLNGNPLHESWTKDREFFFSQLPSGEQKLKLISRNYLGKKAERQVTFLISTPFYQSWWAYLLYLLSLTALIYFLIKWRTEQLRQRNLDLENIVENRLVKIKEQNSELEEKNKRLDSIADQLRAANKLKNEFLGMAAHDLKNPLSVIQGFTDIILKDKKEDSEEHEFLSIILKNSKNMFQMISELLDTSKMDDGDIKLNLQKADLNELILKINENYKLALEQKNLSIHYTSNDSIEAEADIDRMREVFDNLISNAIKYSPQGKNIWIFLKKDMAKQKIRFTVKDEGPGMSEEDLKNAFGRFKRLSAQPTAGESSSGLGLSIVKLLVERHQGKVWIESELGKGCSFIVELPMEQES